jgi:hypothetical protein
MSADADARSIRLAERLIDALRCRTLQASPLPHVPSDVYCERSIIMNRSHRLRYPSVNMTNTAKSFIAGVLLVELGLAAYLLFPKDDQPTVETDAGMNSPTIATGVDSRFGDGHVAAGSVVRAAPPTRSTDDITGAPLPAPVGNVAPVPGPAAMDFTEGPRPEAQSHQQPAHTLRSADVRKSVGSKAAPVPRIERRRDGLHRPGSNEVAAAMTDELVRESAKLNPAPQPPKRPGRQ